MLKISGLTLGLIASIALAGCSSAYQSESTPSAAAAHATHAAHGTETASGMFHGASNHVTSGTASIFLQDGHWVVSLGSDFSFDGAPDPHVALGHNGYRKDATLAKLQSNTGAQVYAIPGEMDVADFNEVWIWCNQFSVPLGSANLTLL